jgi:hypothetical protein
MHHLQRVAVRNATGSAKLRPGQRLCGGHRTRWQNHRPGPVSGFTDLPAQTRPKTVQKKNERLARGGLFNKWFHRSGIEGARWGQGRPSRAGGFCGIPRSVFPLHAGHVTPANPCFAPVWPGTPDSQVWPVQSWPKCPAFGVFLSVCVASSFLCVRSPMIRIRGTFWV